jgi:hypothetical protein
LVKPFIEHVRVAALVVQVPDATLPNVYAVTVYPLMAEPFVFSGASQVTAAAAFDATAVTLIGTDGAAFMATPDEASEASEVPALLVAVTLKVYWLPATKLDETSQVTAGAVATHVAPTTAAPELSYA